MADIGDLLESRGSGPAPGANTADELFNELEVAMGVGDADTILVETTLIKAALVLTAGDYRTVLTRCLDLAIAFKHLETASLLLDKGADANASLAEDTTPIFHAVSEKDVALVELLVKANADVNVPDDVLSPALPIHLAYDNAKLLELFDHGRRQKSTPSGPTARHACSRRARTSTKSRWRSFSNTSRK